MLALINNKGPGFRQGFPSEMGICSRPDPNPAPRSPPGCAPGAAVGIGPGGCSPAGTGRRAGRRGCVDGDNGGEKHAWGGKHAWGDPRGQPRCAQHRRWHPTCGDPMGQPGSITPWVSRVAVGTNPGGIGDSRSHGDIGEPWGHAYLPPRGARCRSRRRPPAALQPAPRRAAAPRRAPSRSAAGSGSPGRRAAPASGPAATAGPSGPPPCPAEGSGGGAP